MARWLAAASLAWPVLLAAAVWQRTTGDGGSWTAIVYFAASRICHQLPERSFHLAAVQWPVCARCSGLYLAAPIGALLATLRPIPRLTESHVRWGLAAASVPTALTFVIEWMHIAPVSNGARFAAALPLGVMITLALVRVADRRAEAIR